MPNKSNKIGILCVGNEVVDGLIVNTNAPWIAQELNLLGLSPELVTSCRDIELEIEELLFFLSAKCSHIIVSGGLGPTSDDLTRQAIARFAKCPLVVDEASLANLRSKYKARGRVLDQYSELQAYFPSGARVLPNPVGTAPAFLITTSHGVTIYSLPGVPKELKRIFSDSVKPYLVEVLGDYLSVKKQHFFQCFGIPESVAGNKIQELALSNSIHVGYRPHFPELEVRIEAEDSTLGFEDAIEKIKKVLSEFIFAEEPNVNLPLAISRLLIKHGKTIAVAESCTAGFLGKLLSEYSGSSSYFLGGIISYHNQVKESLLGVNSRDLSNHGAVSPEVALAMAEGTRLKLNADIGISITGVAGPTGGSVEKPVGLFYIGMSTSSFKDSYKFFIDQDRDYVRTYAAYSALDVIRRFLLGININRE